LHKLWQGWYVQVHGMDTSCPMCGLLVRDGDRHSCTRKGIAQDVVKLRLFRQNNWHFEIRKIGQIVWIGTRVLVFAWIMTALYLRHFLLLRFTAAVTLSGLACNVLAMRSNGGRMPVRMWAYRGAVLHEEEKHQPMMSGTKFKFLCDVHRAVGCVWSLGDLLMLFSSVFGLAAVAGLWASH
jgi:Family of unknown function (DUF5317)